MGESPGNPADAIHPGSVRICTPDASDGWPRDSHAEPGITPISADERRQTCRRRLRHTRRHPARRAFGTTTPEGLRQFTAGAYVHHVFGDPYREEVVVNTTTKWTVAAGLALALALGGGATAEADPASPHPGDVGRHHTCDFFFFNDTATTEIYTLSLHDALPISTGGRALRGAADSGGRRPHVPSARRVRAGGDRKSTRLNSSHVRISYAVFCLKKKMTTRKRLSPARKTQLTTD